MKNKLNIIMAILIMIFILMSGCTGNDSAQSSSETQNKHENTHSTQTSVSSNNESLYSIKSDYSEDDLNAGYDESSATIVKLGESNISISGEGATQSDNIITISSAGTYILSGKLSDGQVAVDATNADVVRIVLDGVDITSKSGSAVYVKQAKKVVITLAGGSQNTISDAKNYTDSGDNAPDAAIYSSDDLTFNGEGTLTVNGNFKHAIKTADDLVVISGTYNITSEEDGLRGKDSISIAGGKFTIKSGGEAIKSTNKDGEDSGRILIEGGEFIVDAKKNGIEAESVLQISSGTFDIGSSQDTLHSSGDIYIYGGELKMSANDDGVHAGGSVEVTGGEIEITQSYEGFEGANITISGGRITLSASDDGLNAAGGSDEDKHSEDNFMAADEYFISITGGYTYVRAGGDGVDSNGAIYISGGTLIVDGPESGANSAMDAGRGTYSVTGGTLMATGSIQMLILPAETTQPALTIIFNSMQRAGTTFALADNIGNIIFALSPAKSYQSIQLTSPSLSVGETYTLLYGGEIEGRSLDGTYFPDAAFSNSSDSASFEMTSANMTIGSDGKIAQYEEGAIAGGPRP